MCVYACVCARPFRACARVSVTALVQTGGWVAERIGCSPLTNQHTLVSQSVSQTDTHTHIHTVSESGACFNTTGGTDFDCSGHREKNRNKKQNRNHVNKSGAAASGTGGGDTLNVAAVRFILQPSFVWGWVLIRVVLSLLLTVFLFLFFFFRGGGRRR